jgi:hypothetical protein
MTYTQRGSDYDMFASLLVTPDGNDALGNPEWRFGKYVHSHLPRATVRQSDDDRQLMLAHMPIPPRGRSHERQSDVAPFVFWDGEGITYASGMPQSYVLFGSSLGHEIRDKELRTVDCLNVIIEAERDAPHAIHVAFAFKYDAEMILSDLPLRSWYVLKQRSSVRYQGYTITYHPGRLFRVTAKRDGQKYTATIYDVFGFFQQSFVKALRAWLDESELEEIERIEQGKQKRGHFEYEELDSYIAPYWRAELRLGVVLCERLRERLKSADICPSGWYGAGAVASTIYKQHSIRKHMARTTRDRLDKDVDVITDLPEAVNDAARYAYAGGRFELFRLGHTERTVYQYDIRSAYPNAIAGLPSLAGARWEYIESPRFDPRLFALWHITYDDWTPTQVHRPGPLFQRDYVGRVCYPMTVEGWYWTPEAALVAGNKHTNLVGAWVCHHNDEYPFHWVRELYEERQARKATGDPSEKAYKLALNSLYGKQAQRLGWQPDKPLPRFHQLEWAGWVTSYTRMMLFHAMQQAGSSLIATETDAVFTLKKLDLPVGTALGEWDMTVHTWMTYLQSGTYWSDHGAKYRGFDADSLTHEDAMRWLRRGDFTAPLVGTTTRFMGAGRSLGTPLHRCWVTEGRDLQPGASGKRRHFADLCRPCNEGQSPATVMHPMMCAVRGGRSYEHVLPWLDENATDNEFQTMEDLDSWDAFQ